MRVDPAYDGAKRGMMQLERSKLSCGSNDPGRVRQMSNASPLSSIMPEGDTEDSELGHWKEKRIKSEPNLLHGLDEDAEYTR